MAKRKKQQPWEAVFSQVRVIRNPAWVYAPPATDAELDAVEARLESRLPQSYREFMKRFGSGELMGWSQLDNLAPTRSGVRDIVNHTHNCREYVEQAGDIFPNAAWFAQLVYFGSSGGGDWYCWDPSAKSRTRPQEYPCYCLHHGHENQAIAAGTTFWEFVAWVDADYRSWVEYGPDEEP